jgi:hypothetical protein
MTMNLDELRDAHAKRLGWETYTASNGIVVWFKGGFGVADDPYQQNSKDHPIPATLDAIAGLMPPNWKWYREHYRINKIQWSAHTTNMSVRVDDTGDELTDRARLAWLAWEAEAKGAK